MKKFLIGSVIALGLVAVATPAKAATVDELQALISSLQAQIAALKGTTVSAKFNSDLTIGSTGSDVTALQNWLISKGYSIGAGATGYFGPQTQAALAKYQAAVGITPAAGYFGPVTRAKVNGEAGMTSGSTSSGSTSSSNDGEEGQLKDFDTIGGVESTIDEGDEEENVLGIEFEAEDSDMWIERIDVDFTVGSGGSSKLDDYIESVALVMDGKVIADQDADEADEDDDVYSFRFTGLDAEVAEGETGEIYVAVTAVSNLDSDDEGVDIEVEIPANGIRAVDEAGISETYVTANDLEETFSVETSTDGELTVSEADESPEAEVVEVDDESDTDGIVLLAIELEAEEQDIEITDLPVGLVASGARSGEIVKTLKLMNGSKTLDSVSISSSAGTSSQVLFEEIDLTIEEGDTVTLKVVADVNDLEGMFTAGDSLYATTTGSSAAWDVEDAEGEDITPSGSVTGEAQTFFMDGINIVKKSVDADITDESETYPNARGVYTIEFTVAAFGEDAYIASTTALASASGDHGVEFDIIGDTFSGTTTATLSSTGDDEGASYLVREGQTETFTLQVILLNGTASSGSFGIELNTVRFDDANSSGISSYTAVTANLDEIETAKIILQ